MRPPEERGAKPASNRALKTKYTSTLSAPAGTVNYFANTVVSTVGHARDNTTRDARSSQLLSDIKSGQWRREIEQIREDYTLAKQDGRDPKSAVASLKKALPGVLWSGQFKTRRKAVPLEAKLVQHSGILCADIDDVPHQDQLTAICAKLKASPYVMAIFRSPTDTGLKVLFRVRADAAAHLASFHAVQSHVRELAGCEIDGACKDVVRLCFVSYDPALWMREGEAKELPGCTQKAQTTHPVWVCGESAACVSSTASRACMASVYTAEQAVEMSVPHREHSNHKLLYKLAAALWAFEETTRTTIADDQLRRIFLQWHTKARPFLNKAQTEDEYFVEFMDAWENVDHPLEETRVDIAWKRAKASPNPPEAIAAELTSPNLCRLIAFCGELQRMHGGEPFFLSPYTVMKLFGQNSHSTAAAWIGGLCRLGILTRVAQGDFGQRRAATYRFNFKETA